MRVITSCNHVIEKAPDRFEEYVNKGVTFDCPECGNLEVMQGEIIAFQSKSFHQWMHDQSVKNNPDAEFHWPADGKNTGYIDIPAE